jgi:hypothetical protein
LVSIAIFILFADFSAKIKTSTTDERLLRPSAPIQKAMDWWSSDIWHDQSIFVSYHFGLEPTLTVPKTKDKWKNLLSQQAEYQLLPV